MGKTYKIERDYYTSQVAIGEVVNVDNTRVIVVAILKIDFQSETLWFTGVPYDELD